MNGIRTSWTWRIGKNLRALLLGLGLIAIALGAALPTGTRAADLGQATGSVAVFSPIVATDHGAAAIESSPSGQAMPVGDLPGWKQIFKEDFNTSVPLGGFPGTAYKGKFTIYKDGWPDTAGKRGKPSRYYPSKVISVGKGVLTKHLHSENGIFMGAAILPVIPGPTRGQRYGKYTVRFRSDALKGYKVAWLLWPDSGSNMQYGEIDFPESDLAGVIRGYVHHTNAASGGDQDAFKTTATYTSWHTASIEWSPGKVVLILDGKVIGTSTNRVPSTAMHWVLQTESCLPTCPATSTAGNVQIDWVVAYARA